MDNEIQDIMEKCGYRKGFTWENRFDLKTKYKDYEISTVDLGLDHSFGIGEPLYYETMIFRDDDGENIFEDFQERYSTQEEAIQGHYETIKYVVNRLDKENKIKMYITQEYLDSRISSSSPYCLLIFENQTDLSLYKKEFGDDNKILITSIKLKQNGLVGLRYYNWNFIDTYMLEQMIKNRK